MQVHHEPEISPSLHHVNEVLRELIAELDVVGAAAPLPVPVGVPDRVVVPAGAGVDGAFTAGLGYGVGHRGAGDGVNECCFSTSCNYNKYTVQI